MSFLWPWMLFSLLLIPVSVILIRRLQLQQARNRSRLGSFGVVRESLENNLFRPKPMGQQQKQLPTYLFFFGFVLLLFATARPQMIVALPQVEGIVMLAFDVSASMAAEDLEPTRMEAAKSAAQAFVEQQPQNIKIGVISFSEGGLVVQTPTDDRAAITTTISRLVPQSGTSLGQGILAALNAATANPAEQTPSEGAETLTPVPVPRGTFSPVVIVLLSDGENTSPPDPLEAAQAAIEQGVRIYTIGVGSTAGTVLEIDGFNVFTQMNEVLLIEISDLTEGEYFRAENAEDLQTIYENLDPQFVVKPEKMEITSILAGLSILILLVGGLLSFIWFGRVP